MCAQILRNVIVHGGCEDTVRESVLKVNCEKKYYMAVFTTFQKQKTVIIFCGFFSYDEQQKWSPLLF